MSLSEKECIPCQGGIPPLTAEEAAPLLELLDGWTIVDGHHLHKDYAFDDFKQALAFVNAIGAIAEEQCHQALLHGSSDGMNGREQGYGSGAHRHRLRHPELRHSVEDVHADHRLLPLPFFGP
ncbi:MAG: hypothetical protein GY898_33455 [Proteobacteria bacterium]|nr:hypothetical protein [Pseudomonadota bacterium]